MVISAVLRRVDIRSVRASGRGSCLTELRLCGLCALTMCLLLLQPEVVEMIQVANKARRNVAS